MFPLKPCWAWTVWKAQGQTIRSKIVANISEIEKEHGLTYTAFSRATRLTDIRLLNGITRNRLTIKIANQAKMEPRKKEERRLDRLVTSTATRMEQLTANS